MCYQGGYGKRKVHGFAESAGVGDRRRRARGLKTRARRVVGPAAVALPWGGGCGPRIGTGAGGARCEQTAASALSIAAESCCWGGGAGAGAARAATARAMIAARAPGRRTRAARSPGLFV